jgi:MFS family permease
MAVIRPVGRSMANPAVRRRLPALADQAASSLSNIVVFILVARSFDHLDPIGAFGLAMVAYQLALGVVRSLAGETLLSLHSSAPRRERDGLLADLLGATLLMSLISSVLVAGVAGWMGGLSGSALLAVAVVLPLVMVQDLWRWVFIVDRPKAALAIDLVWLVSVSAVMALAPDDATVSWFVIAWGATGGLAGGIAMVLGGGWHGRPHPWRWLVATRRTGSRYLGDFVVARGVSEIALSGLGAIAGLGALGAAKASLVYYGVLNTLHNGASLALIPEGARLRSSPERLRTVLVLASGFMALLAAAWMIAGHLIPDAWGEAAFGVAWDEGRRLLLPMGLAMVGGSLASGANIGLRSLGDSRRILRTRLHTAPLHVACPLLGAVAGGVVGFTIGFAFAKLALAAVSWSAFLESLQDQEASARAGVGDGTRPSSNMGTPDVSGDRS